MRYSVDSDFLAGFNAGYNGLQAASLRRSEEKQTRYIMGHEWGIHAASMPILGLSSQKYYELAQYLTFSLLADTPGFDCVQKVTP